MNIPVKSTMNHILKPDGKVVMVAMDHARMNGISYAALRNPAPVIEAIIEGGADAIMTSYGVIKHYKHLLDGRIRKIMRLDTGSTRFYEDWEEYTNWYQVFTVEDALRAGADGVISYSFPGLPIDGPTLANIGKIAAEGDKYSMPTVAEMHAVPGDKVPSSSDPDVVASECRIAAEFGADMIKTDYTGDKESFELVTSCCPVPVILAGGSKCKTTEDTLKLLRDAMDAGAAGTCFGRQIWEDPHIAAMTRAVVAIVHSNVSVAEAMKIYEDNK